MSKFAQDLYVRPLSVKLSEENIGQILMTLGFTMISWKRHQQYCGREQELDKLDFMKMQKYYTFTNDQ